MFFIQNILVTMRARRREIFRSLKRLWHGLVRGLKSCLRDRQPRVTIQRKQGCRLAVRPFQQWRAYSCTAGVLQSLHHYHTGARLSHRKAIGSTGCRPKGATLKQVAKVMKRQHHCTFRPLRDSAAIRRALRAGSPVLAGDNETYEHDHAILLIGHTRKGFWLVDPAIGAHRWRSEKRLMRTSDEFIAVSKQ